MPHSRFRSWIIFYFNGSLVMWPSISSPIFKCFDCSWCSLSLSWRWKRQERGGSCEQMSCSSYTLYNRVLHTIDFWQECQRWHRKRGRTKQLPGKAQETRTSLRSYFDQNRVLRFVPFIVPSSATETSITFLLSLLTFFWIESRGSSDDSDLWGVFLLQCFCHQARLLLGVVVACVGFKALKL